MKRNVNEKKIRLGAGFLMLALCVSMVSSPALAQPYRRPGPPPGRYYGPPPPYRPYGPPPPPHHHSNDFNKALAVVGTVGAIAAIANARNNSYYYYRQPTVVVVPPRPVVVERQVVVEKPVVIEKPVVVERQVPMVVGTDGTYSPKLGASFRIESMQIPGYRFMAARLTSDPLPDSPLHGIGLRRGDVITRLDDSAADTLAELERHERNTLVRYIKTGTTKVMLANVYIPTDSDILSDEAYNAP